MKGCSIEIVLYVDGTRNLWMRQAQGLKML